MTGKKYDQKRFARLEKRIGYSFSSQENLERSLTHASVRGRAENGLHYERLEFLGDRVLGLAIAGMLHHEFPDADEGELSLRLNTLVKGKTLAEIADDIELHEFIRTGCDLKELTGKRMRSIRADALEALIAAIYLDGGLDAADAFVKRFWSSRLHEADAARRDSKTQLQEWAHANGLGLPRYIETGRTGPDHDPMFTVSVKLTGKPPRSGEGRSKRAAEQSAARAMLVSEGVWHEEGEKP